MAETVIATTGPTPPPTATEARPSWLPTEFASVDQMVTTYNSMKGGVQAPPVTPTPTSPSLPVGTAQGDPNAPLVPPTTPTPATGTPPVTPPAVPPVDGKPSFDISKYEAEYESKGTISEESYAELTSLGRTRAEVDNYIAGQVARATVMTQQVYAEAGGAAEYAKLVQWATANLSDADKQAYNAAASSKDLAAIKFAVSGLKSRFQAAYGRDPKQSLGGSSNTPAVDNYRSVEEARKAIADPRYERDEAYRQDVAQRISRSNIFR